MFGLGKGGPPDRLFAHADDCKILAADPNVKIEWSLVETRHWVRTCRCGEEHHRAPAPERTRLDPLDPSTFGHAGGCEHRHTTDPVLLGAILKVKDGAGGDYWWVECAACDTAWQVPYYAESVG